MYRYDRRWIAIATDQNRVPRAWGMCATRDAAVRMLRREMRDYARTRPDLRLRVAEVTHEEVYAD